MKRTTLALLTFILFLGVSVQAEIAQVGVLGFQSWKNERIESAKADLEKAQAEAPQAKEPRTKAPQKVNRGDQKLQQAQLNLEIVQELTVNDYFVLYLSQFKDRSAFLEAARKLNSDEAADLMLAYQKRLAKDTESDSLPVLGAAVNPQPAKPTRLRN